MIRHIFRVDRGPIPAASRAEVPWDSELSSKPSTNRQAWRAGPDEQHDLH
jgi:hypothetical protein